MLSAQSFSKMEFFIISLLLVISVVVVLGLANSDNNDWEHLEAKEREKEDKQNKFYSNNYDPLAEYKAKGIRPNISERQKVVEFITNLVKKPEEWKKIDEEDYRHENLIGISWETNFVRNLNGGSRKQVKVNVYRAKSLKTYSEKTPLDFLTIKEKDLIYRSFSKSLENFEKEKKEFEKNRQVSDLLQLLPDYIPSPSLDLEEYKSGEIVKEMG